MVITKTIFDSLLADLKAGTTVDWSSFLFAVNIPALAMLVKLSYENQKYANYNSAQELKKDHPALYQYFDTVMPPKEVKWRDDNHVHLTFASIIQRLVDDTTPQDIMEVILATFSRVMFKEVLTRTAWKIQDIQITLTK